jgi:hypothetical protein
VRTDRRGFLAALAALPVLGGLFKQAESPTHGPLDLAEDNRLETPNGEPITGLQAYRDRLYVFTSSATYYVDDVAGPMKETERTAFLKRCV